jgi:hypothetical protein
MNMMKDLSTRRGFVKTVAVGGAAAASAGADLLNGFPCNII